MKRNRKQADQKYRKSVKGFLNEAFHSMKKRVVGKTNLERTRKYYTGKPLMPKEEFYEWSRNDPNFLKLFKLWTEMAYDRRFSPSVDRIDSSKGYTLDNVQWLRLSDNCAKASVVRKANDKIRKEVYKLLKVGK